MKSDNMITVELVAICQRQRCMDIRISVDARNVKVGPVLYCCLMTAAWAILGVSDCICWC